jgi:hypothetical protein
MLRQVRAVVPRRYFVMVLAARGLYARWLLQRIVRWGWQPLLRINRGHVSVGPERPLSPVAGVGAADRDAGGGQGDGVSGAAPPP